MTVPRFPLMTLELCHLRCSWTCCSSRPTVGFPTRSDVHYPPHPIAASGHFGRLTLEPCSLHCSWTCCSSRPAVGFPTRIELHFIHWRLPTPPRRKIWHLVHPIKNVLLWFRKLWDKQKLLMGRTRCKIFLRGGISSLQWIKWSSIRVGQPTISLEEQQVQLQRRL